MAMAIIQAKCAICGREFEHRHNCYNRKMADDYEKNMTDKITICPACYAKQKKEEEEIKREKEYKEAVEYAAEQDLPALTGTEKQIRWAEVIRYNLVKKITHEGFKEIVCENMIQSKDWIENRDNLKAYTITLYNNAATKGDRRK